MSPSSHPTQAASKPFPYSDTNKRYHTWDYSSQTYLRRKDLQGLPQRRLWLSQPGWNQGIWRLHLLFCQRQRRFRRQSTRGCGHPV